MYNILCIQLSFINPDKCILSVLCFQTVVWTAINSVVSCWFWRVGVSLGPRRWEMCLLECSHTALYPAAPACPPVKVRIHLQYITICLSQSRTGEMQRRVWCLSATQAYTYHWKLLYCFSLYPFKKNHLMWKKILKSHTQKTIFVRFHSKNNI